MKGRETDKDRKTTERDRAKCIASGLYSPASERRRRRLSWSCLSRPVTHRPARASVAVAPPSSSSSPAGLTERPRPSVQAELVGNIGRLDILPRNGRCRAPPVPSIRRWHLRSNVMPAMDTALTLTRGRAVEAQHCSPPVHSPPPFTLLPAGERRPVICPPTDHVPE